MQERGGLHVGAILYGLITGMGVLMALGLLLGLVLWQVPITPRAFSGAVWFGQALGGLAAGFSTGRRAPLAGWIHGLGAGVGMAALQCAIQGVMGPLPSPGELLARAGVIAAGGTLGGVVGVNAGR